MHKSMYVVEQPKSHVLSVDQAVLAVSVGTNMIEIRNAETCLWEANLAPKVLLINDPCQ